MARRTHNPPLVGRLTEESTCQDVPTAILKAVAVSEALGVSRKRTVEYSRMCLLLGTR